MFTSRFGHAEPDNLDLIEHDPYLIELMLKRMYLQGSTERPPNLRSSNLRMEPSPDQQDSDLKNALQLVYLADKFQFRDLERDALDDIISIPVRASPSAFAIVCKQAFEAETERLCDKRLKATLRNLCLERRHDKRFMTDPSYIQMLKETPNIAADVAVALVSYTDDVPDPARHYSKAKCNNGDCPSHGEHWFYRYKEEIWSGDLHCIHCGEKEVRLHWASTRTGTRGNGPTATSTAVVLNSSSGPPLKIPFTAYSVERRSQYGEERWTGHHMGMVQYS